MSTTSGSITESGSSGACSSPLRHWPTTMTPVRLAMSSPRSDLPAMGLRAPIFTSLTTSRRPSACAPTMRGLTRSLARAASAAASTWRGANTRLAPASVSALTCCACSAMARISPSYPAWRAATVIAAFSSSPPLATIARTPLRSSRRAGAAPGSRRRPASRARRDRGRRPGRSRAPPDPARRARARSASVEIAAPSRKNRTPSRTLPISLGKPALESALELGQQVERYRQQHQRAARDLDDQRRWRTAARPPGTGRR